MIRKDSLFYTVLFIVTVEGKVKKGKSKKQTRWHLSLTNQHWCFCLLQSITVISRWLIFPKGRLKVVWSEGPQSREPLCLALDPELFINHYVCESMMSDDISITFRVESYRLDMPVNLVKKIYSWVTYSKERL